MNPNSEKKDARVITVTIAANFVAELVGDSLSFWFQRLRLRHRLRYAPYDQIIQQLLDPEGLLRADNDCAVIFIQIERWISPQSSDAVAEILCTVEDLAGALEAAARARSTATFILVVCPSSLSWRAHPVLHAAEEQLKTRLLKHPQVDLVTSADLREWYPESLDEAQLDVFTDRLAQIPYTQLGFATLGTVAARRIHCLRSAPRKAIVVDCDNTLWLGVCGEDGPTNVRVTPDRKAFQEFLVKQRGHGRLLCLCSKNDEATVWEVFDRHPDMALKREHFTAWKINWNAKHANFSVLGAELSLGLDSFVFVDDDACECEAMRTLCPEVRTLQIPRDDAQIGAFLRNIWDFDSKAVTAEDQNRALYYRQNAERARAQNTAPSLDDFLSRLELDVQIAPLAEEDLPRAAQLTERTNQFNLNGVRRSVTELRDLIRREDTRCLTVRARDRFGDYGMVGVMGYVRRDGILRVDLLLLSCRALGKRIEHWMVYQLAAAARDGSADRIEFAFSPTARNAPMHLYLSKLGVGPAGESWAVSGENLQRTLSGPDFSPVLSVAGGEGI